LASRVDHDLYKEAVLPEQPIWVLSNRLLEKGFIVPSIAVLISLKADSYVEEFAIPRVNINPRVYAHLLRIEDVKDNVAVAVDDRDGCRL